MNREEKEKNIRRKSILVTIFTLSFYFLLWLITSMNEVNEYRNSEIFDIRKYKIKVPLIPILHIVLYILFALSLKLNIDISLILLLIIICVGIWRHSFEGSTLKSIEKEISKIEGELHIEVEIHINKKNRRVFLNKELKSMYYIQIRKNKIAEVLERDKNESVNESH